MALIEINKNPTRRELNQFGAMLLLSSAAVGLIVLWRFGSMRAAAIVWAVGLAATAAYFAVAPIRRPIYLGFNYAGYPIGWALSHLLLAAIYYLVLTPIGLVMRLAGRDAMRRRFDPAAESYWTPCRTDDKPAGYFRQF